LTEDKERSTEDLVEAIATGDRQAFVELFGQIAPRIKGYLINLGARPGQAEELTQEVMVTIWQRSGDFDRKRSAAGTWIYTIARNRRIDLWRKEQRQRFDPEEPLLHSPDPKGPDEELSATEQAAHVRKALASLPQELSSLIRFAYFDGLSHREIAEKTGIPLGTVKTRIRKATKIIGQYLDLEEN
jgi:RNA polymerase sigma-70 factor, ECF subfamily